MNSYAIASLVIDLISIGLQREEILTRLNQAKASGVPDSELPDLIKSWRQEARQGAVNAINDV
jgi:hypothetical protein